MFSVRSGRNTYLTGLPWETADVMYVMLSALQIYPINSRSESKHAAFGQNTFVPLQSLLEPVYELCTICHYSMVTLLVVDENLQYPP